MSYLVLARKWRPLNFSDVIGQEHVTTTLQKAIEKKRVAHAFIFSGTRGVGKTTTARILARALNCDRGPTPNPCGECDSCKGISMGASLDVLEIDGASNNSVDDIRELRDNVGYSSMGGKYRIFVIDEVHMLSKSAFNALLKTLEEPPDNVIFIFATTEPQKIPATIHSRCQRYDFRRIGPEHVLNRLTYICDQEKIAYEKSALMLIAQKADGSMRDGLSLLDQVLSYCPEKITEKETRLVLGLVSAEVFERVMDAVVEKNPAAMLSLVQDALTQGYDLYEFVLGFEEYVRNLLLSRIKGALQSAGAVLEPEMIARLEKSSSRFSEGDLLRIMEIVRRSEFDIKRSAFPRFAVEMMLLKLAYLDNTVSIENLLASLADSSAGGAPQQPSGPAPIIQPDLKKKADLAPAAPSPAVAAVAPEPARPVAESHVLREDPPPFMDAGLEAEEPDYLPDEPFEDRIPTDGQTVGAMWNPFLKSVMKSRPTFGTFLSLATVAGSTDSHIDLVYAQNLSFQFNEVTKKQTRDEISKLLNDFMGRPVEFHITLDTKPIEKAADNYINRSAEVLSLENEISREPIIQDVIELFDAESI